MDTSFQRGMFVFCGEVIRRPDLISVPNLFPRRSFYFSSCCLRHFIAKSWGCIVRMFLPLMEGFIANRQITYKPFSFARAIGVD